MKRRHGAARAAWCGVAWAVAGFAYAADPFLWGIEFDTGLLYSIDPVAKTISRIGDTRVLGAADLVYNPGDKMLYTITVGFEPQLWKINPADATATKVRDLDFQGKFVYEGAMAYGVAGTYIYGSNVGEATLPDSFVLNLADWKVSNMLVNLKPRDINGWALLNANEQLIMLERETKKIYRYSPDNGSVTALKDVTVDIGEVGGLTRHIDQDFKTTYYVVTGGPAPDGIKGSNALYTLKEDGTMTEVFKFDSAVIKNVGFSGIAAVPEPGTLFGLGSGALVLWLKRRKRRSP